MSKINEILNNAKNSISKVLPLNISSVISLDNVTNTVSLYYKENEGKGKYVRVVESFNHSFADENFSSSLSSLLKIHFNKKAFGKTAIILPDNLFFTDTIKLPVINKKAMNSSLGFAFNTLYTNYKELKYLTYPLYKDTKNAIYNVVGIRKEILEKVTSALSSVGIDVAGITFASNSSIDRAISFNPKMKNADCVLVDVKENFTRISLVVDGKAVAYYQLPFGYSCFSNKEIYREELLFNHSASELLVLNAKEKAKNKKLTTYDSTEDALAMENFLKSVTTEEERGEISDAKEDLTGEKSETDSETISEDETVLVETSLRGKVAMKTLKKLPKYMIRPTPISEEEFIYENFRHIEKWVLEVVRNSQDIFVTGLPKTIYVNMPDEFSSIFETIKKDDDGKIAFVSLNVSETEKEQKQALELYGGLYITKRNKFNVF